MPDNVNPTAELQLEINKLKKYVDSNDLCVAIHLNRAGRLELNKLEIPELNIKELWFFGATSLDQKHWLLAGDMLNEPRSYDFEYPRL